MHYYIDGYNLIFRILDVSEDLQAQREALLQDLAKKVQLIKLSATIVFDAHYRPGAVTRGHYKDLEVVYTSEKESADDYIHRKVRRVKNPKFITVVTSDKKLAWLCRQQGCNTESIPAFLRWLNRRYQNELAPAPNPERKKAPKIAELPKLPPKEGTLSYYEAIFEGKSVSQEQEPLPPPRKEKRTEENESESDFDRWMRLFGGEE